MKKNLLMITALLLSAVIIYGQAPNTWTRKADFAGGTRRNAAGFSIGKKGYVGTSVGYVDLWEYDPALNKWTTKADFPGYGRDNAISFSIGNKGYIGRGMVF